MEFALVNGIRSVPSPKLTGECQVCRRPVIAKCGPQLIWHWAHKRKFSCDPWWENEGHWHRTWKNYFPTEFHEIVAHDSLGEKHIADLKLADGLVIELQHSSMSIDEMRSREVFYDKMIWIVDAEPFRKNITIFDPLPNPKLPFVNDLVFISPDPLWRRNRVTQKGSYNSLMLTRRSKYVLGSSLVEIESGRTIEEDFDSTYRGHHLFLWMRPREIWYKTDRPTFLDFGDGFIGKLMRYREGQEMWCIKLIPRIDFINRLRSRLTSS
jgi:competence protein CoiA